MKIMHKLSCLRAKLWFLAVDNEHAMREPPPTPTSFGLCWATNISFIIQPVKMEKKGHKQVFQRTNTVWGILVSQGELNKQGSYRFKGTAKNLWRHVWTGATVNSLASWATSQQDA